MRKVDVVLVDWDHSLLRAYKARQEDVEPHAQRMGWNLSLRDLNVGALPPTSPDWDMLRTILILWLQHGPQYEPFRPLAARKMTPDDWMAYTTTHLQASQVLRHGQLGEPDGLRATLDALQAQRAGLKLNQARLARLRSALN